MRSLGETWRMQMLEERIAIMAESGLGGRKALLEASQDTSKKYWETILLLGELGWSRNKANRFLER